MPYQIIEPHPTALPNHYMHTGRGGAGNTYKISSHSISSPVMSKIPSNHSAAGRTAASTGRGGAGNIRPVGDLPTFSLDEEMDAQVVREKGHDVWHVGRGGAGNWTKTESEASGRKTSSESLESEASSRSGFLGRLSGVFERH